MVDSLALHSSYSSVRLESFLFTEEAFRDIKARLKPGGVFIMYNWYRQGWLVCRLAKLGRVGLRLPAARRIDPVSRCHLVPTTICAITPRISWLATQLRSVAGVDPGRSSRPTKFFWLYHRPPFNLRINGFGRRLPSNRPRRANPIHEIGPVEVELRARRVSCPPTTGRSSYLREPAIPALNLRGMAIVAVLSLVILLHVSPRCARARPNAQMFFLGAGFMLLETKGVVHMALLFGSTWMVNSIVFFAILFMILLSNLYVLAVRPRRLWPYYLVLLAALPDQPTRADGYFLALPGATKVIASCAVVYLPVFFAGVIFATAFRSSVRPDIDFGSNVGGIILGGLTEYLSLIFGFNALVGIAIGYYALSALFGRRLGAVIAVNTMPDLHSWDLTTAEARDLQLRLAAQVDAQRPLPAYETIAGADVSYDRRAKWLHAAVVVLRAGTFEVLDRSGVLAEARFPYVPGLLTFREAPAVIEAYRKLKVRPDILICDGQGIAHPRGSAWRPISDCSLAFPRSAVQNPGFLASTTSPAPSAATGHRCPIRAN